MRRQFTVQCGYSTHYANTVIVEAHTLEEALEKAIAAANEDGEGWLSTDHCSDTYVDAVCEGANGNPWGKGALPVPGRFSEHGAPPAVPLAVAAAPAPHKDATRKRAIADAVRTDLLRLMPPDRTVTVTVRDGNVAVHLGPPEPAAFAASRRPETSP